MPSAKAGRALTDALGKTSGLTKVGIINSLGFRRETRAVPALVKLLTDQDAQVAAAAATALGQIGGSQALRALQAATPNSTGPVHNALVDACLRCANRLLAAGSQSKALAIFQRLYDTEKRDGIRTAAYRGMIQASGKRALPLMTTAILGADGASQTAALQLVREVAAPGATKTFASLLPVVEAPVQVALIEGLSQRGDISAASAIAVMVQQRLTGGAPGRHQCPGDFGRCLYGPAAGGFRCFLQRRGTRGCPAGAGPIAARQSDRNTAPAPARRQTRSAGGVRPRPR